MIPTEGRLLTLPATIQINCSCGWTAHVSAKLAGKHLRCRECQAVIAAPTLPPAVSSPQELSKQATPIQATPAPAAKQRVNHAVVKSRAVPSKRATPKSSGTTQRRQQGDSAGFISGKGKKTRRGNRGAKMRRSSARSERQVAALPAYEDDYGPEFDEPEFLKPSPTSRTRRGRKKSLGSKGISQGTIALSAVLIVFAGLVFGGYTLIRSDAFARIAGQQFRSVQPVYDAVSSKTTRQIQMSMKASFPISIKAESHLVVVRDATAENIQLTIVAARIDQFARHTAPTPEISELITPSRLLSRSQGVTEELSLDDAPETVADFIGLLGVPIVGISRDSNRMGQLTSLVANPRLEQQSRVVFNTAVFIDAPFAANVDWWDVERTLNVAIGDGIHGTIRYEKLGSKDGDVTVSLNGTLSAKQMRTPNGVTLASVRLKVSGQQVYSTAMNDWKSGECVIEFTDLLTGTYGDNDSDIGINLSFQTRLFEDKAHTLLKMEDFPKVDPMQELRDLTEGKRN